MKTVRRKTADFKRIKEIVSDFNELEGQVGFFPESRYEDGTPVAYVATIQEFGYIKGGIPPRSFMRSTAQVEKSNWATLFGKGVNAAVKGNETAFSVVEKVGQQMKGDIQKTITEIKSPPLKESTVAAKRRKLADSGTTGALDKPLIETSLLLNSVTNATVKK